MAEAVFVEPAEEIAKKLDELLFHLASDGHSATLAVKQSVEVGEHDSAYKYKLIELRGDRVYQPGGPIRRAKSWRAATCISSTKESSSTSIPLCDMTFVPNAVLT